MCANRQMKDGRHLFSFSPVLIGLRSAALPMREHGAPAVASSMHDKFKSNLS